MTIIDAYQRKKLVLFIGAGLSAMCGIPPWKGLTLRLINECKNHGCKKTDERWLRQHWKSRDYAEIAERCYKLLPRDSYITVLTKACGEFRDFSKAHKVIPSLSLPFIITTNFDRILENTFVKIKKASVPVFTYSPDEITSAINQNDIFIFKIHGDINRPDSLILTRSQYDRIIEGNGPLEVWLNTVFFGYTLLFVGYSMSDPDINYFFGLLKRKLGKYTRAHFAITSNPWTKDKQNLAKRFNITFLQVKQNSIHKFLKQLKIS
jgi:hypothetical protein